MKCSLIITTKNEAGSIANLLDSILDQTHIPDEIVISDAGSTDATVDIIALYRKKLPIQLIKLSADANRAVGRNRAIEASTHEIALITDAGCVLDRHWVEYMLKPFHDQHVDVVAGYYRGEGETVFEQCQIPFVLVMPDKVDPDTFLPATRSMGIRKSVWQSVGKFTEQYRYAEDYAFARRLREQGYTIVMAKDAIVIWRARTTLQGFSRMIREHAQGDAYSRTWRPKVLTVFARYVLFYVFPPFFYLYLVYAIVKNYRYCKQLGTCIWLPILQVSADVAVMWGTLVGLMLQ